MAVENTRALLDEINSNMLTAIGEVKDLTAIKELMKNDHILDGYRIQCEEDKIWNQHERELKTIEVNKELKELEMEVKKLEIEQKREQFILENEFKKDELKLKEKMHEDEMAMRNHENHRAIDANDIREKELELRREELKLQKRNSKIEHGIKIGFGVGTGFLAWLAVNVGNEGILNDMAKRLVGICTGNWLGKA